jgi:putative membrane protein
MRKAFDTPQRQSPLALVMMFFKIFRTVIGVIWPALIGILVGKKEKIGIKVMVVAGSILLFVLIRTILDYLFFHFHIQDGQLIVRKGFFTKKNITVPLERIQAIHLEQSFLHTLTATHKVLLDTAGTNEAEITIYAINTRDAIALRELILSNTEENEATEYTVVKESKGKLISVLNLNGLLKLSLSANHLETMALIMAFIVGRYEDVKLLLNKSPILSRITSYSEEISFTWQVITTLFVLVLIITIIISCIRIFLRFYNYTIRIDHKGFYIKWGLIQVRQKMIPFKKIQLISWRSNFIRRLIGLGLLNLKVTGNTEEKRKMLIEVPITDPTQINTIISSYQLVQPAQIGGEGNQIHRSYAIRRLLFITLPALLIVIGLVSFAWQWNSLWLLLWLPYSYGINILYWKNFRFWVTNEGLQYYKSTWGKAEAILNWKNIQYVRVRQSIYQRRKGLATIILNTAGGGFEIPYLTYNQAIDISNYALYRIESSQQNWM